MAQSYEERVAAHLWTETDAGQSVIDQLIDRHIAVVERNRKAGVSAKRTATQLWSKHRRSGSARDAVRAHAIEGWEITYYEPRYGNRTFTVHTHAKLKDAESWLNDGGYTFHVRQIPKGTAARTHREAFLGGIHRSRAKRDASRRRYVVRKNGFRELYLQKGGRWGGYRTARRFSSQNAADKFAAQGGHGIFPG